MAHTKGNITHLFSLELYDDFINQWLTMDQKQVFYYILYMARDPFLCFWEYQKRSSLYYKRNGAPIENPKIPDGAKICPRLPEDRQKITEACLASKEVRMALNKIVIHRVPSNGLIGLVANAILDLW